MSDYYINKSALLEQFFKDTPHCQYVGVKYVDDLIKDFPTVDEKEIIRKSMECILKRLQCKEVLENVASVENSKEESLLKGYILGIKKAIKIVKEEVCFQ